MNKRTRISTLIAAFLSLFLGCSQVSKPKTDPKLYYFGATWCGPCVEMKKLFKDKDVKKELAHYDFRVFDYDILADKPWFDSYNIMSLPTSVFVMSDKIAKKQIGKISKRDLLLLLKKHKNQK